MTSPGAVPRSEHPPRPQEVGLAGRSLWSRPAACVALLVLAVVAVHGPSLGGVFFFDDDNAIERNEFIRKLWPPARFFAGPPESPLAGRPLASFSVALDYALWGLDPRGFHLTNLLIHACASIALWLALRSALSVPALRARWGARAAPLSLAAALLWLVHPLQTECVAYVSQRTESLMGLAAFTALFAAIRAADGLGRGRWMALAVLAALMGAASKEVMVVVPVLVMLFDRAFLFRTWREAWRRRWPLYAGLASSWVVVAATMSAQPRSATVGLDLGMGTWEWLLNQSVMITRYLGLFFWPHTLVADYGRPVALSFELVWPRALLVLVLVLATLVAWWRWRGLGFLGLWFWIVLAPTSSVIPIISEVGAERRMYVSSAALVLLAVLAGDAAVRALGHDRARASLVSSVLVAAVALALGARSFLRHLDYRSEVAIWRTAVAAEPSNARAHKNLAVALHAAGRLDEALEHYELSLEIVASPLNPAHRALAHYNVGCILQERGALEGAVDAYRRALRDGAKFPAARGNLGGALLELGRPKQAEAEFRQALAEQPRNAELAAGLARALEAGGDLLAAREAWRRVLEMRPGDGSARSALARLEGALRRP